MDTVRRAVARATMKPEAGEFIDTGSDTPGKVTDVAGDGTSPFLVAKPAVYG